MSTLASRAGVGLLILFAFVVFLQCEKSFVALVTMSEDSPPSGREQPAPIRSPAQTPTTVASTPPVRLPDHITYALNAGYRSIPSVVVVREIGAVSHWYASTHGLKPKLPTHIRFEPECSGPWGFGEAVGTTEYIEGEDGAALDVCVRLDGDSSAAIQSDETRWVLAHEYFHALQANAGWADQLGGDCGEQLSEGSAEYFGQMYAFGKIDRIGLGDLLDAFIEPYQFLNYEVGVEAFDALVKWKGERKAARFWESDLDRCADAFLVAFGVSPGKYEEDWNELTSE